MDLVEKVEKEQEKEVVWVREGKGGRERMGVEGT